LARFSSQERDDVAACNPDLHFNRATVHSYLGEYSDALRGFESAAARDRSLNADAEIQKILKLVGRLEDLVANKGRVKAKKLAGALAELGSASGEAGGGKWRPFYPHRRARV
jgi:hypothetical protein